MGEERFVAADGTVVPEAKLAAWVADAEAGNLPGKPGPVRRGRPLSIGEEVAVPVTIRLDPARRLKLQRLADARHVSRAQVVRELLDQAVL